MRAASTGRPLCSTPGRPCRALPSAESVRPRPSAHARRRLRKKQRRKKSHSPLPGPAQHLSLDGCLDRPYLTVIDTGGAILHDSAVLPGRRRTVWLQDTSPLDVHAASPSRARAKQILESLRKSRNLSPLWTQNGTCCCYDLITSSHMQYRGNWLACQA